MISALCSKVARAAGSPVVVAGQVVLQVVALAAWAILGFSETFLLIFNLFLSMVSFSLLFIIQSTQNRDGAALHAKLDEIIHNQDGARNELERAEERDEKEIERLRRAQP